MAVRCFRNSLLRRTLTGLEFANIKGGSLMAKLTRKFRKRKRKEVGFTASENRSIDKLIWDTAKSIVDSWHHFHDPNQGAFCICDCGIEFCVGYDNTDCYCYSCKWMTLNSCLKRENPIKRTCQICKEEEQCNESSFARTADTATAVTLWDILWLVVEHATCRNVSSNMSNTPKNERRDTAMIAKCRECIMRATLINGEYCRVLKTQVHLEKDPGIGCKHFVKRDCFHNCSWGEQMSFCNQEPNDCQFYLF